MALHYPVIDPPSKPSPHRLFVFLDSCSKGAEFGDVALVHLGQPSIEIRTSTLAEHLGELLDQLICLIHLSVQRSKQSKRFFFFSRELEGPAKKQKHGLPCQYRRAWKLIRRGCILPPFW